MQFLLLHIATHKAPSRRNPVFHFLAPLRAPIRYGTVIIRKVYLLIFRAPEARRECLEVIIATILEQAQRLCRSALPLYLFSFRLRFGEKAAAFGGYICLFIIWFIICLSRVIILYLQMPPFAPVHLTNSVNGRSHLAKSNLRKHTTSCGHRQMYYNFR